MLHTYVGHSPHPPYPGRQIGCLCEHRRLGVVNYSASAPFGVRCEQEQIAARYLRRGRFDGLLRAVGNGQSYGGLKGTEDLWRWSQLRAYGRDR